MRLITGDECGLLKECIPGLVKHKDQAKTTNSFQLKTPVVSDQGIRRINNGDRSSRRRGVVSLAWTKADADTEFASLHMDGTVELWERSVHEHTRAFAAYRHGRKIHNIFATPTENSTLDPLSRPLSLSRFDKDGKSFLCACNMAGKVVLIDPDESQTEPVLSSFSAFKTSTSDKESRYPIVSAMAVDRKQGHVACGGKERETVLWDLQTSQQVWKAKNLPPDKQTLLQPQVWPTAIHFLNKELDPSIGSGGKILAVGTAHKEVRIYDIRTGKDSVQRRPIAATPYGLIEHRVTSMCQIDAFRLAVGDAAGFLHAVDLRKLGKKERVRKSIHQVVGTHGRFVGPAGSIQEIVKHDSMARMGLVSLDRMLRVYDTNTKKELSCMYLKQRLKCVLVGREKDTEEEVEDALAHLDDQDIDQEDVVDDYVDSDEENEVLNREDQVDDLLEASDSASEESAFSDSGQNDSGEESESDEGATGRSRKKRRQ